MSDGTHGEQGTSAGSMRRTVFRVLGIVLMGTALALIGLAVADFFSAMGSEDLTAEPTRFWMFFLALPFFIAGAMFLNLGFSGAAASYMADEYAPAMRTAGRSLGLGGPAAPSVAKDGPYCRSCGTRNDAAARFCDSCGTSTSA